MKKLFALILSTALAFGPSLAYASPGTIIKGDVLDGFENILVNPSVERSTCTNGWTVAPTSACDGTNLAPGQGRQSVQLTLSTSSGVLFYQDVTPIHQFGSTNMEAGLWVKTSTTGLQVCPRSGGTVLTAQCVSVPATGTWQPVSANMIGPSSGTVGVALYAPSSIASGTVNVDGAYVGRARNLSQVSQAQLVGQVKWTGCSAAWSYTTTSLAAPSNAPTGCTASVSGQALSDSSGLPEVKFSSLAPGLYVLKYEGVAQAGYGTANGSANFQFWDGTNTAKELSVVGTADSAAGSINSPGFEQTISYTTSQSNVTFSIRGFVSPSATLTASLFGLTSDPGVISVYYYPSQSQLAVRADQTPASWSGGFSGGGFWTVTPSSATTWTDMGTNSGTLTLGTRTSRNMTCTALTLPQAGVSCSLPRAGNYQVCANSTGQNNTAANVQWAFRLADGSGTLIGSSTGTSATAGASSPAVMCGNYNSASGGTVTFKIQGAVNTASQTVVLGGAGGLTNDSLSLSVTELDAPMPAPYLVGSVTSKTSGTKHPEDAIITTGTSTCTFTGDYVGWIASATSGATGNCSITFATGAFSGRPRCTCTASDTGGSPGICSYYSASTTGISFETVSTAGTARNSEAQISCSGPG